MLSLRSAFRNQRPSFRNIGIPYGDKPTGNARGLFHSRKSDSPIHFWSWQELNFIKLAEAATGIIRYESRPERVMLRSGPEWFAFVPHFRIEMADRHIVVELSHLGRATTHAKKVVADLAFEHYRSRQTAFVGIPHCVVRADPRMHDANVLMRYLSAVPDMRQILCVHDALWLGPKTVQSLSEQCDVSVGLIMSMIRTRDLSLASAGPLGRATLVGLPQDEQR